MRHEQQDIDEESQQGDEQSRKEENKKGEQVSSRMRGRMEVSCNGQAEYDQVAEGGNWVYNEQR